MKKNENDLRELWDVSSESEIYNANKRLINPQQDGNTERNKSENLAFATIFSLAKTFLWWCETLRKLVWNLKQYSQPAWHTDLYSW